MRIATLPGAILGVVALTVAAAPASVASQPSSAREQCRDGLICFHKPSNDQLVHHATYRCYNLERAPWTSAVNYTNQKQIVYPQYNCKGKGMPLPVGQTSWKIGTWRSFNHF
ncbi:hypothetical protein [Actinomadura sp. GTD37]|uniref:hypothetical protein n=1 Tax=Actinomadura sp. GTD37 TaxID=1778030 RepID=UPI0035C18DEA